MPRKLTAWAALTAALALAAIPGPVGSHSVPPATAVPGNAFQAVVTTQAPGDGSRGPVVPFRTASSLSPSDTFVDAPAGAAAAPARPKVTLPKASPKRAWKEPRTTLSGVATWYANGTTAMRLPRGTVVVICGKGGCVERTINDWGPIAGTNRVVDLMPKDFVATCGCGLWKGIQPITVRVY